MQDFESLCQELWRGHTDARNIGAGVAQARNDLATNRIRPRNENDGNCSGCSLCRCYRIIAAAGYNDCHSTTYQTHRQTWQDFGVSVSPTVLDRNITLFGKSSPFHTRPKCDNLWPRISI